MEKQPGMNTDVTVGVKRLHIQTSYSATHKAIISNIFDNGRVTDAKKILLDGDVPPPEIDAKLQKIHKGIVADIQLFFFIAEKVRQVKHAASCLKLGQVFFKKGFHDEAIDFFTLAIEADENLVEAHKTLGLTYLAKNDLEHAEQALKQALNMGGGYADLNASLASVHIEKHDYNAAMDALATALTQNPQYFEAHYLAGVALLQSLATERDGENLPPRQERSDRAGEHFLAATRIRPQFQNDAFAKAETARQEGDLDAALKAYKKAHRLGAEKFDMMFDAEFYLKFMYGGKGKDNRFVASYLDELRREIERHPNYADLHNNLGIAYLIMCRNLFLKALEEFREALRINPKYKKAKKNLKLSENDGKGFLILLRAILK